MRRPNLPKLLHILAGAAGLLLGGPAAADNYRPHEVEGWTVTASADERGCFIARQYDGAGGTTLSLGLDVDGQNRLSVLNDNWSIKPRQRLKLAFRLSNGGYVGHPAIGMIADGKQGFVATFDDKFPGYFAASEAIHIARGDVPVEQLSLAGSGAAVAELRRCVDAHRGGTGPAKASGSRSGNIPRDPFAPGLTPRKKR